MIYFHNYNTFKTDILLVFDKNNPHAFFALAGNKLRTLRIAYHLLRAARAS